MNSASLFDIGVLIPDLLLPENADARKWACIACDQYTSQPEIWDAIDAEVGAAPSTLRLILPETQLPDAPVRVPEIQKTMEAYARDVLTRRLHGFVLTARTTPAGCRKGLMLAVDLEQYDYSAGSASRIRATEGTILSRIPPRMQVRRGALLESPHIMLLADDKARTLMTLDQARGDAPLFAVGDGNHSLATAKAVWEELKPSLTPEQRETHPARWALCEVVNLYDEALVFAPIHRVLTNVPDASELLAALSAASDGSDAQAEFVAPGVSRVLTGLPVEALQPALDDYLSAHPGVSIDYVHGDDAARALGRRPGCCALLPDVLDKLRLFPSVAHGPLPRKAFSMGQASEKRCYFECRRIR